MLIDFLKNYLKYKALKTDFNRDFYRGLSASLVGFELWELATPVQIWAAPLFKKEMDKLDSLVKLHGYICSDGTIVSWKSKDIHGKRLRIRKRLRTKFYNNNLEIIQDFIQTFNICYPKIKSIKYYPKRFEVEIKNDLFCRDILELGKVWSKNWEFPNNLNEKQKRSWICAFADCDGTVSKDKNNKFIAIDSINFRGLKKISKELINMNIKNKIYSINNGKSYRLKIFGKENLIKYSQEISFAHPIKNGRLIELIKSYKK